MRILIAGIALCAIVTATGGTVRAEAGEPEADPGSMCISFEELRKLEEVVAEALISDCETGTGWCVDYTGTLGDGPEVGREDPVVVRYSAWVVRDISEVTAPELWEYGVAGAPVRDRLLRVAAGETGPVGLRTALFPRGGDLPRVGSVTWLVMPRAIAGKLRDGLPRIPADGGVAARVELLEP